jgi:hypothetical protein
MNSNQYSTTNYLVPAAGNTHAVNFEGVFSATAQSIDWRQFGVDNFPFNPQGVFIDNTQGVSELSILIKPINFTVKCPAGQSGQYQFPAPNGQTCEITGNGQASIFFVDFPVLPNAGEVNIAGTIQAAIASVSPGVTFDSYILPTPVTAYYDQITGATVTKTITPAAQTNLKKLILSISANATTAAGGTNLLTLTLNGTIIYKSLLYFATTAQTGESIARIIELDFANLGLNAGAGGLVVTIVTALNAGAIDINAYFGD